MIGLNASIGGEAIGLMGAGFDPLVLYDFNANNVAMLHQNWREWKTERVTSYSKVKFPAIKPELDLVSAGLLEEKG